MSTCATTHSSGPYGENLFLSTSTTDQLVQAVHAWYGEVVYFSCQDNTCSPNAQPSCGHYTQLMWASSANVGCGMMTNCTGKWHTVITCNYDPPGNIGNNGVMERPYPRMHFPRHRCRSMRANRGMAIMIGRQ